jgi:hypothetical protein
VNSRQFLPALLLLALAACSDAGPAVFETGTEVATRTVALPRSEHTILWVLQPADYVRCESFAREVRRIQRQAPESVSITLIAVGGYEDWARSFLTRERIAAKVFAVTPREFRREFGRAPHSALYVLEGSRVTVVYPATGSPEMDPGELSRALASHDGGSSR